MINGKSIRIISSFVTKANQRMKHFQFAVFTIFLTLLISQDVLAQQNHFIYIQTEDKQAFYVKLDKKVFSSSASGYLLVPKLKDGTYNLTIGFPKSEWAEQNMACTIDKNDVGYLLKNFGNKGWGLFNFQTLAVIMSTEKDKVENVEVVNQTDAFSNMLSNVVNDSTIRQTETVKKEEKKAPVIEEQKTNTNTTKVIAPVTDPVTVETQKVVKQPEIKQIKTNPEVVKDIAKVEVAKEQITGSKDTRSAITRSLYNKNETGTEMVFLDDVNGKKDTIRVFIPAEKSSVPVKEEKSKEIDKPKVEQKSTPVKQEEKPKDSKFLDIELPNPNQQPAAAVVIKNAETKTDSIIPSDKSVKPIIPEKKQMINSDCKNFATDEDFLKLRKKMAAEDNDDDMIILAKKTLKIKCFTVEQVKNLSVLFLKDAGKYTFFDTVYPFVSDSHNFSALQNQLTETYYINRFQVMIRH